MFQLINTKNFKSLGNFSFDLRLTAQKVQPLSIIYGPNGIGKSNLTATFNFLAESLTTMNVNEMMQKLLSNPNNMQDNEKLLKAIKSNMLDMSKLIAHNKTIDSNEPMILEFFFFINGHRGSYTIKTDNTSVIYEKLEYTLSHNKGICFEISPTKNFYSDKVFLDKQLIANVKDLKTKYWGKHSLLAILNYDMNASSSDFYKSGLSTHFQEAFSFLLNFGCRYKIGNHEERGQMALPKELLFEYSNGNIPSNKLKLLDNNKKLFDAFLPKINNHILSTFYKLESNENGTINYKLYLKENINNYTTNVDFKLESTGTQAAIELLYFILSAVNGNTVIIDEFESGLHEQIALSIMESVQQSIKGQLIVTTHQTRLLESPLLRNNHYNISENENGTKQIKRMMDNDIRTFVTNNMRKSYLANKYKSCPQTTIFNFQDLFKLVKEP